jgi:hypothetical protein
MTSQLDSGALGCYVSDNPDWLGCAFDGFASAFGGQAAFGLIVAGAVVLVMYRASGEMTLPTVTTILLGGFAIPTLPAQYRTMALSITVVGIAAALWMVVERYVLSGAAA